MTYKKNCQTVLDIAKKLKKKKKKLKNLDIETFEKIGRAHV